MNEPASPRIPPQRPEDWAPELVSVLTGERSGQARLSEMNIFTTLARHAELFKVWLPFGGHLLNAGKLPHTDRELVILRTGFNCHSAYEWGQHVRIALRVGIDRETIRRTAAGPAASGWSERQRLLLQAADELHTHARISDATWSGLTRHLDEKQLIELPILVGQYHLVAFTVNSLAVQPEPGLEPLPAG